MVFGWLSKRDPAEAKRLISEGNRAEDAGDAARACELYRKAVKLAPGSAKAHLNLGIGLEAAGDDDGAEASYKRALELEPASAAAAYNLGKLLYTRRAYAQAEGLLEQALEARPDFPEARIVRGYVLQALGQLERAAEELLKGLEKRPQDEAARAALSRVRAAESLERALTAHQAGRRSDAQAGYEEALVHDPQNVDARHFLGVLAYESGDYARARELISRALEIRPENAHAHFNLGRVQQSAGELASALASYRKVLALHPVHGDALFNMAGIQAQQGNFAEAIAAYRRVIAEHPGNPAALCNLGTALKAVGRRVDGLEYYRKAIAAAPEFVDAHYNLAVALRDEGRNEEAIAAFRRAVELRPDMADAHFGLGHALRDADRNDEAIASFERALSLDPDHVQARWSRTIAHLSAVPAYGDDPRATREEFASDLADLERWFEGRRVEQADIAVGTDQPFELAYQEENNRPLLERYGALCARLMDHWRERQGVPLPAPRSHEPLRVGIVSAHVRKHSVWSAITRGWFEALDPGRFHLYVFHLGLDEDDETSYAKSRAKHYERGPKSLRQWVDTIRAHEPDVLIYPEVGMDPMTVRLASLRLARVQAATWGHPETTGLPTIDYYLSGENLEPHDGASYYTERLVRLPGLGCRFNRISAAPDAPDLALAQADSRTPLLICPGVPFKYAPQHDSIFPGIAKRLGECRFVFFKHRTKVLSERLERRLQAVFKRHGLPYDRFVSFVPWQPAAAFMGWLRHAHVYLDTIGFSGFNTALYAVEAGLPIVTREGRFLRGRLASGILKTMGLHELVVPNEAAYVELAVRLVRDGAYRQSIAARVMSERGALFEDRAAMRAMEDFLIQAAT